MALYGVGTLIPGSLPTRLVGWLIVQITVTPVVRGWHIVASQAAGWIQLHEWDRLRETPPWTRGKLIIEILIRTHPLVRAERVVIIPPDFSAAMTFEI